ncbi:MAG: DNA-binding response regulator [Arachnia sp.]
MTEIMVAVLDDHQIVRDGIQSFELDGLRVRVAFSSGDTREFERQAFAEPPDVAVIDLNMDGRIVGHETIGRLSEAGIRCIALTADYRRLPIRSALDAGARGLVLKSDGMDFLRHAIVEVFVDGWANSTALASALIGESEHLVQLSAQERKCLLLASQGVPLKAIGSQLSPPISVGTVKTYLARAYEKFHDAGRPVANTTAAVVAATQDGWFDLEE